MAASQKIFKVRRYYNRWVADQTLEDYSLRYTAQTGRKMSIDRVAKTALGATAFLALESLAATVTLNYGFINAITAILTVLLVFFITGFPIAYYSAKHGLDIDLLTRGAGFGYLGSTITSLIYATFTFIFFAIEAAILASALHVLFGIPLAIGYLMCALFVIPIVTHGIKAISRFQIGTQSLWLVLQCSALFVVLYYEYDNIHDWSQYSINGVEGSQHFDVLLFGAAASVLFALVAQIGEQVDYLRFMPAKNQKNKKEWWFWLILAGPGWVIVGAIKMLLGSFLAYLAIQQGMTIAQASDPTHMYQRVFQFLTNSPQLSLIMAATMVFISQMKINVTNAYAGSIAWSNFFSRLTHSHPGRVVWLVFNVTIALLLMELGIYQALEAVLGVFAIGAISWLASLSADLLINKPLKLSPSYVEFKRAHLYDINPVGTGSMLIATSLGLICYLGVFGEIAKSLCHFVSLFSCFIFVPLIAWLTKGKYYLARQSPELLPYIELESKNRPFKIVTCGVCENQFEQEDMSFCSAYMQPICSLCCSLDVRCLDHCKPQARVSQQAIHFMHLFLPYKAVKLINSRLGRFLSLLTTVNLINAALMSLIYHHMQPASAAEEILLQETMWALFFTLLIVSGVLSWLFLLAHESRVVAQKESNRQTRKLMKEIEAHEQTDKELQRAKETAESANAAKSRYLTGISHELRTPLQSIIGYAQLLAQKTETPKQHQHGLATIQRSGEYLTDLIEGLLDISKIEAGRLELYRNQVNLPELIEQLANMFSIQATSKGIQFHYNVVSPLPQFVITDEKRLRQILINLLSNAVKYTKVGQVHFNVSYRNQVAEFSIKDTGPGIHQHLLDRIFDPFERVRDANTANLPGTGLGLTIVKLLTEIMGGDLNVDSQPDSGSQFRVTLMLPWVARESIPANKQKRIVAYKGYQRTLCIVDDDPILRGLLAEVFVPLGFIVLEAHSAEACLTIIENTLPDLFLLDISMPGMSGLVLADTLRHQNIRKPIIMLSADAQENHPLKQKSSSYDDYLVKPISNSKLLNKVAEFLAIEWVYQEDQNHSNDRQADDQSSSLEKNTTLLKANTKQTSDESFYLPEEAIILELKAYAEMGYRRGVKTALSAIESRSMLNSTTLKQIHHFDERFEFEALVAFIEQHSEQHNHPKKSAEPKTE
ncbi:ATP-binding protein [Marinomonas algicola]|uniref:hybrid sensor histidine kinase/response regulator n=1 Tax=Marinomonas algicola TaxID=2773454 RepID=UPI0017485D82|nr:ATP-binding protein [Marinomonas algicola]